MQSLVIPKGIDLKTVLPPELHRHEMSCYYFLSQLVIRRVKGDRDGFIPCKRDYLVRYWPRNAQATQCIDILLDAKIVETDGRYIPGSKAKGYRLGPDWLHAKTTLIKVSYPKLETKLKKTNEERLGMLPSHHKQLRKNLDQIRIDDVAFRHVEEQLRQADMTGDMDQHHSWNWQSTIIHAIKIRTWIYRHCEITGRITTGLTCIRKDLRKYLTVQGDRLVQIDTTSCHPLLLSLAIQDPVKTTDDQKRLRIVKRPRLKSHFSLTPERIGEIKSEEEIRNTEDNASSHTGHAPLSRPNVKMGDLGKWISLCESGVLYEHLVELLDNPKYDRAWAKLKLLSEVCYGELFFTGPMTEVIKVHFPTVYAGIRAAKQRKFSDLAVAMMKLESTIVIETAAKELVDQGIWLATLHDALVCRPGDAKIVEEVLRKSYQSFGVNPKFKTSSFSETKDAVIRDDEFPA